MQLISYTYTGDRVVERSYVVKNYQGERIGIAMKIEGKPWLFVTHQAAAYSADDLRKIADHIEKPSNYVIVRQHDNPPLVDFRFGTLQLDLAWLNHHARIARITLLQRIFIPRSSERDDVSFHGLLSAICNSCSTKAQDSRHSARHYDICAWVEK